jgi:hypothetical protein
MATHILTVGAATREASQTFAFVEVAAPVYTCTNDGAPAITVVVGDTVIDTNEDEYLITVVTSQVVYTVTDYKALGAPNDGTTDGSVGRSADKLSSAEADIPDYVASISSSDTVEWRCYDDSSAMDDKLTFGDVNLGTGATLIITSPLGERHTGTAGTGFTITPGSDGNVMLITASTGCPNLIIEFIEITGWDGGGSAAVRDGSSETATETLIRNCIFHDPAALSGTQHGIRIHATGGNGRAVKVYNTLIYDCGNDGVRVEANRPLCEVRNCTIRNNGVGIDELLTSTDTALVENCAVFDNTPNFSDADWHVDSDFNASNDAASDIPGGDSVSNIGGLTGSDQFKDLTDGSEDFRTKGGSALRDAGADLSSTFTKDIVSATRIPPFDIGAFQFTGAAGAWFVAIDSGSFIDDD